MGSLFCCSVVRVSLPLRKQTECMMGVKMLLLVCLLAALQVAALPASVPESPYDINDPGLQKAILGVTYFFNSQSKDDYVFKISTILRGWQQKVTGGQQYDLDLEISRTLCLKRYGINDMNFCPVQPEGRLHQTYQCQGQVWVESSLKAAETRVLICKPTSSSSSSSSPV